MHLVTRSTPYVTIVVLVGYRTVLVVFRISSIEVLKQRLRATVATRGGRVSATVDRATATSLMTKRSTCVWCGLFNHLTIGTDLVRPRERSAGNQGIDETRSAERE